MCECSFSVSLSLFSLVKNVGGRRISAESAVWLGRRSVPGWYGWVTVEIDRK